MPSLHAATAGYSAAAADNGADNTSVVMLYILTCICRDELSTGVRILAPGTHSTSVVVHTCVPAICMLPLTLGEQSLRFVE